MFFEKNNFLAKLFFFYVWLFKLSTVHIYDQWYRTAELYNILNSLQQIVIVNVHIVEGLAISGDRLSSTCKNYLHNRLT